MSMIDFLASNAFTVFLIICIAGLVFWIARLRQQRASKNTKENQAGLCERQSFETALRESERKYRDVFENTHDSIALLDVTPEGRFRFADINPVNRKLFNKPYDEIIGSYVEDIFHPADVIRVIGNLKQCIQDGVALHFEDHFEIEGVSNHIRTSTIPIRDDDHKVIRVLVVAHDATEEVRAHQDKLQAEQSRHVLESQLLESRKLESLGRLAGGIAHDFNNLLGAILGFSEFILDDTEPSNSIHTYAGRIQTAGLRGKALIQKILTFVRETKLDLQKVSLGVIAHETVDLLVAGFPKANRINLEIQDQSALILADQHQVGEVLVNLCMNAQDSSEGTKSPVLVRVFPTDLTKPEIKPLTERLNRVSVQSLESWSDEEETNWGCFGRLQPEDDYVSVTVTDCGCGMSLELLNKIFEPFFTTKERAKGTGLGLPVVMGIVLEHNGAVLIKTNLQHGTTFEVIFPRLCEDDTEDSSGKSISVEEQKQHSLESTDGMRVLLIDDNQDFADMLSLALIRQKFDVTLFTDPQQGVRQFVQEPQAWDVLVTDQTMPNMTGLQVIAAMQKVRPDPACILITGYDENLTEDLAKASGASALLSKPVNVDDLAETLRTFG